MSNKDDIDSLKAFIAAFKIESKRNNVMDQLLYLMSFHARYMDLFLDMHHFILRGDGPLPYSLRYFIGILAAARHQCCCLVNTLKYQFLHYGGDPTWLRGISWVPPKIMKLYDINKFLAHRPWLLHADHFEALTKDNDSWSVSEIVHAIVILVHYHSLSSFFFASGINKIMSDSAQHDCENVVVQDVNAVTTPRKVDVFGSFPPEQSTSRPIEILKVPVTVEPLVSPCSPPSVVGKQEVKVEMLVETMKRIKEESNSISISQEELSKRFQTIEKQSAELMVAPQRKRGLNTDLHLFIDDPNFIYQDFSKRGQPNSTSTFRIQDYSWEEQGYSFINSLYAEVGTFIDNKFKKISNLTYNSMGEHKDVDTSRFRIAIWNYIQCLYGIKHDDYDYNEVNQLLERSLKTFIKNAVCYPERVSWRDLDHLMSEFKLSEKIHLNIIILEARMQGQLLYALRTLMGFMNQRRRS